MQNQAAVAQAKQSHEMEMLSEDNEMVLQQEMAGRCRETWKLKELLRANSSPPTARTDKS